MLKSHPTRLWTRLWNRLCRNIVLALAVIAASGCSVNPSTADRAGVGQPAFGPAWQRVDCKNFDVPDAIAARSDCGYVTVPEQHAQADGRTIRIAVVRTRSAGKAPAADPVFVEQGGPGDTTIGVFANRALPGKSPGMLAMWKNRDFIFMEERGTQYSRPYLSCPEINAHNLAVARGEKSYTDPGWIRACNERFKAEGINPSAFNTIENAADIYFVAETLGYRQFNFYGGSYGTLLGQYVIAQADQHKARLRSAILDGVVRPDVDFNLASSHTISHALRNVFRDCARDARCNAAYPDLERKFLAIIDQLNRQPVAITLTVPSSKNKIATKLDGAAFVEGILMSLYGTAEANGVPKLIHAASRGDFGWIVEPLSGELESANAKEMYHTVLCARARSVRVTPDEVLPPAYAQLLPLGQREADVVRNACDAIRLELKPPFSYRNTDIPTLILNGSYDPVTPEPYGKAVAGNFKTAYVYTFPGVGHISLILKPGIPAAACSAQIAAEFLDRPDKAPDGRCIAAIQPAFAY
jgi:pimeloyl-ACP methyl ester carboxylesterase